MQIFSSIWYIGVEGDYCPAHLQVQPWAWKKSQLEMFVPRALMQSQPHPMSCLQYVSYFVLLLLRFVFLPSWPVNLILPVVLHTLSPYIVLSNNILSECPYKENRPSNEQAVPSLHYVFFILCWSDCAGYVGKSWPALCTAPSACTVGFRGDPSLDSCSCVDVAPFFFIFFLHSPVQAFKAGNEYKNK